MLTIIITFNLDQTKKFNKAASGCRALKGKKSAASHQRAQVRWVGPGGGEGAAQVVGGFATRKREEAINGEIKPKMMGGRGGVRG